MKCPKCQTENSAPSARCENCGAPLDPTIPIENTPTERMVGAADSASRNASFVGNYRIIRELGRGGMGVVYEAEQQQPRRLVALKVIQGGVFVDETRVRLFQREAQALARLRHPSIAAIHESGCTDDGKHFFAMELVRGETLKAHLERDNAHRPLAQEEVRDRLTLFRKICDAVSYAHQRGIIHRDLKPFNVLVLPVAAAAGSAGPAAPEIKVLDFGLARITEPEIAIGTTVTAFGQVYGTVPYMSPEQFRANPDEIDIRTDVYSLGVILYEMLTGRLPFDVANKSLPEAERIVCEQSPAPLSTGWLGARRPDGDLQTIVAKALEKEPHRRYQSVAALSEDLERYLHDQPILARPPSAWYQLRKMVVRHKIGFAFSATVLVMLAAFSVTMAILSARVAAERDRAEKEAARANAINLFLLDTLGSANPMEGKSRDVTVLEALRLASKKIEAAFADQPEVEAQVRNTIGTTYLRLGHYADAEPMLRSAIKVLAEHLGAAHLELVGPLSTLGVLRQELGDRKEAESLYRQALAIKRRHRPEPDEAEMDILNNLAQLLQEKGELAEAGQMMQEILAYDRKTLGPGHVNVGIDLNNVGNLLVRRKLYRESEPILREALAILEKSGSAATAVTMGNLGEALAESGRTPEAEPLLADAVSAGLKRLGDKSQDLAKIRVKYASCLVRMKKFAGAEEQALAALPVLKDTLGGGNEVTRRAVRLLADLYDGWGKPEQAAPYRAQLSEPAKN